jgi:hypothetical protein
MEKLKEVWTDITSQTEHHPTATNLSLSHILSYSIDNLLTAYENNINTHFHRYLRKYILCHQLSKAPELDTKHGRQQICKQAAHIINILMHGDTPNSSEVAQLVEVYQHLVPLCVQKRSQKPRCYDMKVNPWPYLRKMVDISRMLEHDFQDVRAKLRKLYNPLPFHSSFVPNHIRLDTSGISQLLMDKARIQDFKRLYELEHFGETLQMTNKADMLRSFEKLLGRPPRDAQEGGQYATDVWRFLTNLDTCRHAADLSYPSKKTGGPWVFDNAVLTDGTSISIQTIEKAAFGRKCLFGPKKPKTVGEKEGDLVTLEQRADLLGRTPLGKVISCDPGKNDILFLTDGVKSLRYTKGQRDQDMYVMQRRQASDRLRKRDGLATFETEQLSKFCSKSCTYRTFKEFLALRQSMAATSEKVYSRPLFRQSKFTTFCKRTASEMQFFTRVHQTFSSSLPAHAFLPKKSTSNSNSTLKPCNKRRVCCLSAHMAANCASCCITRLEIAYGNWGRHPNALKGCAPTPGIGIRRRCQRFFDTFTVPEHGTSKTCPCCKTPRLTNPSIKHITRHHLLRCTNEACPSRWWNRNVAGSLNILDRALVRLIRGEVEDEGRGRRSRTKVEDEGRGRRSRTKVADPDLSI